MSTCFKFIHESKYATLKGDEKMTLNTYINRLRKLQEEGYGECEMIYARDDEGNSFHSVNYMPSLGHFTEEGEFIEKNAMEDDQRINSVCVN